MSDLLVAIGLVLVIEGLVYGAFPSAARRLAEQIRMLPDSTLRAVGVGAMVAGVIVVWLVRGQ